MKFRHFFTAVLLSFCSSVHAQIPAPDPVLLKSYGSSLPLSVKAADVDLEQQRVEDLRESLIAHKRIGSTLPAGTLPVLLSQVRSTDNAVSSLLITTLNIRPFFSHPSIADFRDINTRSEIISIIDQQRVIDKIVTTLNLLRVDDTELARSSTFDLAIRLTDNLIRQNQQVIDYYLDETAKDASAASMVAGAR